MRHPLIAVFEPDGRLARQLEPLAAERKWVLRESRQVEPCLKLLAGGGPSVLVVRLDKDHPEAFDLLGRVIDHIPGVRTVAVGEVEESVVLAGVAWDLGVDFVLFPPTPVLLLPDVVAGLLGGVP